MKLFYIIFLFLFGTFNVFSQTIIGVVTDNNNNTLSGVTIINQKTKKGIISDINGEFKIKAKINEVIKLSYIGKKTKYHTISIKDTLFLIIKLEEDYSKLKEFVVDGKRIKKVSAKNNDNILDYYSLGKNTLLVLKSSHKKYFLTIEGIDTVYKKYLLFNIKPKSLFLDVFGNFHILTKDSAFQVYFDSKLHFASINSIEDFLYIIKPIISVSDTSLLSYKYSVHNKKYSILMNHKKIIFEIYDKEVADYTFHFLVQNFGKAEAIFATNTGDLNASRKAFVAKAFYKKILAQEIKVQTFVINNSLLTFDYVNNQIISQNINGNIYSKTDLKTNTSGSEIKIIKDQNTNNFYSYSIIKGLSTLEKINVKTGEVTNKYELNGLRFPKKVKVIDGWAYFIKINKAGFHKLYRMTL